jgi:lipopolysaccharide/colanic/teichoic acid biosynthesis glycosyltransferase
MDSVAAGVSRPGEGRLRLDYSAQPQYVRYSLLSQAIKRILDVSLASIGLFIGAPLFLIIAILIKLDTRGPVFFRQSRVGRHRSRFLMWKFRKMPVDLPKQGPSLTTRFDTRLTRMGRILERTKLDELPQLLNVLWGEMSVVGPRPEVEKFIQHYPEKWDTVLSVKPGVFGLNQLRNRNESELYPPGCDDPEAFYVEAILPDKLAIDADYARAAGPWLDLWLVFRCLLFTFGGMITWQTIVNRRWQIANFVILTVLGILTMTLALHYSVGLRDWGAAQRLLILAGIAKACCLLVFRIPKSLASSMTADDMLRLLWCDLCSTAILVTVMVATDNRNISRSILVLDFTFFLAVLIGYKLLLYKIHINFFVQENRDLNRWMVVAAIFIAPFSVLAVAFLRHGTSIFTTQNCQLYGSLSLLALLTRSSLFLLKPVHRAARAFEWLVREWPKVMFNVVIGSNFMVLSAIMVDQRGIGRMDIVWDALFCGFLLTVAGLWQNSRQPVSVPVTDLTPQHARRHLRKLLVVGEGMELSTYLSSLATLPENSFQIAGVISPHGHERSGTVSGYQIMGCIADLALILKTAVIDRAVVLTSSLSDEELRHLEQLFVRHRIPMVPVGFSEHIHGVAEETEAPVAEVKG